ncbi:hypothetical protein K438DRAFT_1999111 [Mycena galopus ATCC 62051]|nr:hypothetical protein K438DRAFT_1999111 [Mycena galopus ATCC 62051]
MPESDDLTEDMDHGSPKDASDGGIANDLAPYMGEIGDGSNTGRADHDSEDLSNNSARTANKSGSDWESESGIDDPDPSCLYEDEEDQPLHNPAKAELEASEDEEDSAAADPATTSSIAELQTTLDFIQAVKDASLENGDLDTDTLSRLCNPLTEPLDLSDPVM